MPTADVLDIPDLGTNRHTLQRFSGEPRALAPVAHDAPASIQYTSGTTARPKAVVWTQANCLWAGQVGAAHQGLTTADVNLIHAMLDLWQATDEPHHLAMANTIAQRIIDQRFRDGLFVPGDEAVNVRIDSRDALALLHVAAAHKGKAALSMMPADHAGRVDFTCEHDAYPNTRHNRVSDNAVLYAAADADD